MSGAEDRARLTVAHDAIERLIDNHNVMLSRKDIFIVNKKRQNGATDLDLQNVMAKKSWQQDFLKRLVQREFLLEERDKGQTRYEALHVDKLRALLEGIEDEGTHVYDAKLRLSALLWPRDVIVPTSDAAVFEGVPESDLDAEPDVEVPESPALEELPPMDGGRKFLAGMLHVLKLQAEQQEEDAKTILEQLTTLSNTIKDGTIFNKARQSQIEKVLESVNNGIQGVIHAVKTQQTEELTADALTVLITQTIQTVKDGLIVEVQKSISPLQELVQNQTQTINKLFLSNQQVQSTKYQDLASAMRKMQADMDAMTNMCIEVLGEKEANEKSRS